MLWHDIPRQKKEILIVANKTAYPLGFSLFERAAISCEQRPELPVANLLGFAGAFSACFQLPRPDYAFWYNRLAGSKAAIRGNLNILATMDQMEWRETRYCSISALLSALSHMNYGIIARN